MRGHASLADCCSEIKVVIDRTDKLDTGFHEHERVNREEFNEVWKAINSLRNRLPNWAVLLISTLMAISGWLVGKAI